MTISDEEYFYQYEKIEELATEIVTQLEPFQNFLEEVDPQAAEEMLKFMAWFEQYGMDVPRDHIYKTWDTVINDFEEHYLPELIKAYGSDDKIAMREAFNNYTDMLCKEGEITEWQYNNNENPY